MNTAAVSKKLREIFDRGLCSGVGSAGGQVCVEAAICEAFGEPHGDNPTCVHEVDRTFFIGLNDAPWSSPSARAEGMWPIVLLQLGTAGTDRSEWLKLVYEGTIRRIVPLALQAAASLADPAQRAALEGAADRRA